MPLLEERIRIKPIEYTWAFEANRAAIRSRWDHEDGVSWTGDLKNWKEISERERSAIGGILKGFTLIENLVGCYWSQLGNIFKVPEILAMTRTFSQQEVVHLFAYQALEDNLGLDTYETFTQDPVACKKLGDLVDFQPKDMESVALSLAIFSGAVEGVSLFSSFAVLQSLCRSGKFNAMRQILSWSQADENLHSSSGIRLYKTLVGEYPEQTPQFDAIEEGFRLVVRNELAFISQIFEEGDLPTITKDEVTAYILDRANSKFFELTGKYLYSSDSHQLASSVKEWMDPLSGQGSTMNDFFSAARNGTGYSASVSQDFENVDLEEIWKNL